MLINDINQFQTFQIKYPKDLEFKIHKKIMHTQSQTDIEVQKFDKSNKQTIQNLSPQMKKQLGVYIQIIHKRQRLQQTSLLKGTILADQIQPKVMFVITIKILITIILLIYFLNIFLPKPLKVDINGIPHDPSTGEQCTEKTCDDFIDFIQQMQIKHLSPLNRKIEVYLQMDQAQLKRYQQNYKNLNNQTLVQQIDKVQIFKTLKQGQQIGERISVIEGQQIIEQIVNGKPMYYAGDVHVIDSPNFLIRVVKKTKKIVDTSHNDTIKRLMEQQKVQNQQEQSNKQLISDNNNNLQSEPAKDIQYNSKNQQPQTSPQKSQSTQNIANSGENSNNQQIHGQNTQPQVQPIKQNEIKPQKQHEKQSQNKTNPKPQPQPQPKPQPQPEPVIVQQKQSFPLIITAFYHSYSYTFLQLLFRFIFLVLGIYVISQTPHTPRLLHYIMIAYCNPFIFLEVASPTFIFSIISSICQSSYICFLLIFIYYTHSKSQSPMIHYFTLGSKLLLVVFIFVVNVLRLQHTFQDFEVYSLQTTLLVSVFVILGTYVWDMIVYYKQQLYRDIVTVTITLWYMLIGFVSNYAIMLGWEELIKFVIVQIFSINLCYLVNKYEVNPRWKSLMNIKNQLNGSNSKQNSNSTDSLSDEAASLKYDNEKDEISPNTKNKRFNPIKKVFGQKQDKKKVQTNSSKNMKTQQVHNQNQYEHKQFQNKKSPKKQQIDSVKQGKIINYINIRTNQINYI